jgi:hypothetical protein
VAGYLGFVVKKVALGKIFSEYFDFSCQSFRRLLPTHHHLSSGAGKIDHIMVDVQSGFGLTTFQETKRIRIVSELIINLMKVNTIVLVAVVVVVVVVLVVVVSVVVIVVVLVVVAVLVVVIVLCNNVGSTSNGSRICCSGN